MEMKDSIFFCKTLKAKKMAFKIVSFYIEKRKNNGGKPLKGTYRWDSYPMLFDVTEQHLMSKYHLSSGFLRVFPEPHEIEDIGNIKVEKQMYYGFIPKHDTWGIGAK